MAAERKAHILRSAQGRQTATTSRMPGWLRKAARRSFQRVARREEPR